MGRHQQAAARQLDFGSRGGNGEFTPVVERRVARPVPLCVVCGRHPAHLTLTRQHGHAPARLCLRCHHAVMQHRRMLRADLSSAAQTTSPPGPQPERTHHLAGDVGLIVPKGRRLSAEARHAVLNHRRRRAQVAARKVLDFSDCSN